MRGRGVCNASLGAQAVGRAVLLCALCVAAGRAMAADSWGGAVDVTSDYLVRGISRTSHDAALQLDSHYANSLGFFVGAFSASTN